MRLKQEVEMLRSSRQGSIMAVNSPGAAPASLSSLSDKDSLTDLAQVEILNELLKVRMVL